MAPGKAEIRGRRSYFTELITPRPITRLALAGIGLAAAQALWIVLPLKLLSAVSGVAASFALLCAGGVWAMRDKADTALLGDHLNADDYGKAHRTATELRARSTWRAAFVGMCALVAALPVISIELADAAWHWMVLICGVGVSEAAYSFLVANAWEEQLRLKRADDVERTKRLNETKALSEQLSKSTPKRAPLDDSGWKTTSNFFQGPPNVH